VSVCGHQLHSGAAGGEVAGRVLARVIANRRLGSLVWLSVEVPGWPGARPGQFVLLQAEPSGCFLSRPLSIADQGHELVSFLIAPIGTGTRELAALTPGAPLWVLGPLGNGFALETMLDDSGRRLVLVAGGVGVAPFPLLLRALVSTGRDGPSPAGVLVLLGFRDAAQAEGAASITEAIALVRQAGIPCRSIVVGEDGTLGPPRRVSDVLAAEVLAHDRVVVCGPWAMLETIWSICRQVEGVETWFSLETMMACGVGSCHGCVLPMADGALTRVCVEGPVFTGERVWGRRREGGSGGV
jgi:dihydroorotate dehydrogenase electron transfer subunit